MVCSFGDMQTIKILMLIIATGLQIDVEPISNYSLYVSSKLDAPAVYQSGFLFNLQNSGRQYLADNTFFRHLTGQTASPHFLLGSLHSPLH